MVDCHRRANSPESTQLDFMQRSGDDKCVNRLMPRLSMKPFQFVIRLHWDLTTSPSALKAWTRYCSSSNHLRSNWVTSGQSAVQQTVQTLAKNAFTSLPVEDIHIDRLCASGCWLHDFMARQHFSLRAPEADRSRLYGSFLEALEKARLKYLPNRIFNVGETS
jgi:hypothetical protein